MKHRTGNLYTILALAGALFACPALAQDKPGKPDAKKKKAADLSPEEMMKKAEAVATPGPAHKALEPLVGEWNVTAQFWMTPDGKPTETKGASKVRWILGGRFVQEEFDGEFMGQKFHGIGLTGYDNMKKKYVGSWVDDMSTGIFASEGTLDSTGKVFTFQGKMDDPMTGERNKPFKFIIRMVDANKHMFEMHDLTLGDKSKTMEMTYTRK